MTSSARPQRRAHLHLFPEAKDIFTEMKLSFLVDLIRLVFREGIEPDLKEVLAAGDPIIWLPEEVVELITSEFGSEAQLLPFATRERHSVPLASSTSRFIAAQVIELLTFFTTLQSEGRLDQFRELVGPGALPIWIDSEHANVFKKFVLDHKLHEIDRQFRILLISATCQCRGKTPTSVPPQRDRERDKQPGGTA